MSEAPQNFVSVEESENDSNIDDLFNDELSKRCRKLQLPVNILAYLEKREVERDSVVMLACDYSLMEKVTGNYIIAKQILSNLCWQEKLLCKLVCSTWHSAIRTLQKEQLKPQDFIMTSTSRNTMRNGIKYKNSDIFHTEPMAVLTFANTAGFNISCKCITIRPTQCNPPCRKEHCLMDSVQRRIGAPKQCMLTAKATNLCYMPLLNSRTYKHRITRQKMTWMNPLITGVYIPVIPDVQFHVINIKSNSERQTEFMDVVDKIAQDRIFKGFIIYVTEKFILHSVEDIVFLHYFKQVQPNIPYALGGCIIEDAMFENSDVNNMIDDINDGKDFVTDNLVSIGMFTIPKNSDNKYNFDMYSFVLDSYSWTKPKIQNAITEFSNKVPRFEYSVALKLSCVGRDQKHDIEQDYFRAAFPNTRIVGCYGNGELGVNHPERLSAPKAGTVYSYSSVFVYIGWGKIISAQGPKK